MMGNENARSIQENWEYENKVCALRTNTQKI